MVSMTDSKGSGPQALNLGQRQQKVSNPQGRCLLTWHHAVLKSGKCGASWSGAPHDTRPSVMAAFSISERGRLLGPIMSRPEAGTGRAGELRQARQGRPA